MCLVFFYMLPSSYIYTCVFQFSVYCAVSSLIALGSDPFSCLFIPAEHWHLPLTNIGAVHMHAM